MGMPVPASILILENWMREICSFGSVEGPLSDNRRPYPPLIKSGPPEMANNPQEQKAPYSKPLMQKEWHPGLLLINC
jgi:hypothetical protein